jgi:hypothetical protein
MRVFSDERLQLGVPALELEVMPAQVTHFCLEPLVLRLEPSDVFGQGVNRALLLVRVRRAVESHLPEGFLEQTKEVVRATHVGLVDLPGHRVG